MMKVNIPVEPGNKAAKAGKLSTTIKSILAELKPEAVYFSDDKGQRTGYLFFEMTDLSQIPAVAEPWFLAFNAAIEIHPVMVPDDLAKAEPAIKKAARSTVEKTFHHEETIRVYKYSRRPFRRRSRSGDRRTKFQPRQCRYHQPARTMAVAVFICG